MKSVEKPYKYNLGVYFRARKTPIFRILVRDLLLLQAANAWRWQLHKIWFAPEIKNKDHREEPMVSYLAKLVGTSALLAVLIIYASGQAHPALDHAWGMITG